MYNILVNDCVNKCKFIYNIKPVLEDELFNIFDIILQEINDTMPLQELHVCYISETECDIYIYKEHVSKGWVWNSYIPEKQILYKLETIAYLTLTNESNYLVEESSQTDIKYEDKQTQYENDSHNSNDSNDDKFDDITFEINDCCSEYEDTDSMENSYIEFSTKKSNIWNKCFQEELKDRLNLENFGLYKYKKE